MSTKRYLQQEEHKSVGVLRSKSKGNI